jgi:hypothetical protein
LRFYIDKGNKEAHDYIYEAERKSMCTCEVCGKPGKTGGNRWIETLCDDCKKLKK